MAICENSSSRAHVLFQNFKSDHIKTLVTKCSLHLKCLADSDAQCFVVVSFHRYPSKGRITR